MSVCAWCSDPIKRGRLSARPTWYGGRCFCGKSCAIADLRSRQKTSPARRSRRSKQLALLPK